MNPTIKKLRIRLEDSTTVEQCVPIIRALADTRDVDAIPVIATVLDCKGPIGAEAVRALIGFGVAAEPQMRRCLEALDEDVVRNAHRVLGALGDEYSRRAQHAYCWADLEEEDAAAAARADDDDDVDDEGPIHSASAA